MQEADDQLSSVSERLCAGKHMGSSSKAAVGRTCAKQKAVPEEPAQEHSVCLQMSHSKLTVFYMLHYNVVVVYKTIWECDL